MLVHQGLKFRLVRRMLRLALGQAALVFLSAGSWAFWQGWAWLGLNWVFQSCWICYFYGRDPRVLERRLLTREKNNGQKAIIVLLRLVVISTLVLSGLDHRLGLTRAKLGRVPAWLALLALLVVAGGQLLFAAVLHYNRFAASIIQVETGQSIAASGPYRWVRHPMYLAMIIQWLATPLALGSFAALAAAVFTVPVFVLRVIVEEKTLRHDLPGYAAYCARTRHKLIPFVW